MHTVRMANHLGTHIEVPYHCFKSGWDLAQVPLERLFGEAIVLDVREKGKTPYALVAPEDLRQAAEKAGGMKPGDIVLAHTGYSEYYGTPRYAEAPVFTPEALQWLIA